MTRALLVAVALSVLAGALTIGRAAAQPMPDVPAAKERDRAGFWVPDYVRLQTGGFVGMVTVGVGYSALRDLVNVGGTYGWVPPRNGDPAAHLGTLTASLRPLRLALSSRLELYPLYAGGGLFFGYNVRPRAEVVEDSPIVRWGMLFIGAELALRERPTGAILRHSLFIEEITLGPYLLSMAKNDGMHLTSAFSTAVGYRASF